MWSGHGCTVLRADCLRAVPVFGAARFDAIVTDPPYELGFMGKAWDQAGVAFNVDAWRAMLHALKPGGFMLAFGGTRTSHRMVCAIEDAGFEIRDSLHWFYGTGFPKSLNLGEGRGTALKPAHEPICLAMKPLDGTFAKNLAAHGTGALNIDACRIGGADGRWPANVLLDESAAAELDAQTADLRVGGTLKGGEGRARAVTSPLDLGPRAAWQPYGDSGGASRFFYVAKPGRGERDIGCEDLPPKTGGEATERDDDSIGVQNPRAGANRGGGARNYHPTVKPVALMRYLVKLITPPGGLVLDPFAGSGTTGMAARLEGRQFLGIDRGADYFEIARRRIAAAHLLEAA